MIYFDTGEEEDDEFQKYVFFSLYVVNGLPLKQIH